MKKIIIILCVIFIILCKLTKTQDVIAQEDEILMQFDNSDRLYTKLQLGNTVSYFHQRMLGEAIVEKDFIRYKVDFNTKKIIEHTKKWRDDIPEKLSYNISQDSAEIKVDGEIESSKLYFISPNSDIFRTVDTALNPCWIVRSRNNEKLIISIIDAISGEKVGFGIPPPFEGLSICGPDTGDCPQDPYWVDWSENAQEWFNAMGYNTIYSGNAFQIFIQDNIQSDEIALFYEIDHGGSYFFHNRCDETISGIKINNWIADYASMPFAFIGSCEGMCEQGVLTFTNEFLKGTAQRATVVGYCHMDTVYCDDCWSYSIDWQNSLFVCMLYGYTVQNAFNIANLDYPICAGSNCMRFAGDPELVLVPKIKRSYCGQIWDGQLGPLNQSSRGHFFRCDIYVPFTTNLTIGPGADLFILNNSKITAWGSLFGNGNSGQIKIVSEKNNSLGIFINGQIKTQNGGQIKIFEN